MLKAPTHAWCLFGCASLRAQACIDWWPPQQDTPDSGAISGMACAKIFSAQRNPSVLPDHELMSAWPSQAVDMSVALMRKSAAEPSPTPALAAGNSRACSQDRRYLVLI